jgi:cytochrome bd-type quinol oxidase subunit 2
MAVKLVVILLLIVIVGSLGSALLFLLKDKGETHRTVKALTVRISLSILAFLILMAAWWAGLITPNSNLPY